MGAGTPVVENITMRLCWPNLHAGTIIGKGGAYIKAIREETSCRLNVADAAAQGAERLVTIVGVPLSVNRAVELMLDKVEEVEAARESVAGSAAACTLKMFLENHKVGVVIGKGGAQIKSLREESGASIRVETPSEGTQDRLVTISGGKAEVVLAHQLLVVLLASVPDLAPEGYKQPPAKVQRTQAASPGVMQGFFGQQQQPGETDGMQTHQPQSVPI